MKQKFILTIILYIAVHSFSAFAADNNESKEPAVYDNEIKTIVFLPFSDYTGSGYKYIPAYLSELFKENFKSEEERTVFDYSDIKKLPSFAGITAEQLQDKDKAVEFLRSIKADIGITGRFIIQDKTIRIESGILFAKDGRYEKAHSYEGVIDDRLLTTLSNYTISYNEWMKDTILQETIAGFVAKDKGFLAQKINIIKNSSAGGVLKNRWVQFLLIIFSFFILSLLLNFIFEKVFKKLASKTSTDIDDNIIRISKKPVSLIIIIFGIKIALFSLNMSGDGMFVIGNILTAFIIICFTYIIAASSGIIIHSWGTNFTERFDSRIDDDLVPLFSKISKIIIYAMGIIMVLSRFNIDIAPLIASLGIAGFAIGFAVKDTLSNIIGGIILILDHSFVVGDKVSIDDDTGTIQAVGLRNTKLLTYDNELIVIPNGELMNKKFKNYVLPDPTIRVVINFGVAYGTDIDFVQKVVIDAVNKIEGISSDPAPAVDFIEMADFSLNLIAKFWVPVYVNQYTKKLEATKLIYNTLNENNINIPFPTHTVYIEKNQ